MEEMRLQKYLAICGVASRRGAEKLISEGHIAVNGVTVTEMGIKVKNSDKITLDGQPVKPEKKKYYIIMTSGVLIVWLNQE